MWQHVKLSRSVPETHSHFAVMLSNQPTNCCFYFDRKRSHVWVCCLLAPLHSWHSFRWPPPDPPSHPILPPHPFLHLFVFQSLISSSRTCNSSHVGEILFSLFLSTYTHTRICAHTDTDRQTDRQTHTHTHTRTHTQI